MRPRTLTRLIPIFLALALALALAGLANALDGGTLASADAQFTGESADDGAGYRALAGVGDVNGDGYDDMLIGAPYNNVGVGAAYLVLGAPGGWGLNTSLAHASIIKYSGEGAEHYAGSSVAGAGDVNDDGYDDMLIGAPGNSDAGYRAGAAYLVLGAASFNGGNLGGTEDIIHQYSGEGGRDRAGIAVAGAGDVNGDGYADLLVGADGNDDGPGDNGGAAYLILGGAALVVEAWAVRGYISTPARQIVMEPAAQSPGRAM